jgi:molybdate-binding protein
MMVTKFVEVSRKRETITVECPACSGTRSFADSLCESCAGLGVINIERDVIDGYEQEVPASREPWSIAEFFDPDGTVMVQR